MHVDLDTLATALYVEVDDELKASRSSTGGGRGLGSLLESPMRS